jgi:hypothetical protein
MQGGRPYWRRKTRTLRLIGEKIEASKIKDQVTMIKEDAGRIKVISKSSQFFLKKKERECKRIDGCTHLTSRRR